MDIFRMMLNKQNNPGYQKGIFPNDVEQAK
jgi:hypothetical protein